MDPGQALKVKISNTPAKFIVGSRRYHDACHRMIVTALNAKWWYGGIRLLLVHKGVQIIAVDDLHHLDIPTNKFVVLNFQDGFQTDVPGQMYESKKPVFHSHIYVAIIGIASSTVSPSRGKRGAW